MGSQCRPRCVLQNHLNRFAAHSGNDNGIRFLRRDSVQSRTQAEIDAHDAVLLCRLPGMLQWFRPDIRRNGGVDPPFLQQVYRQIAVIRSHIGKTAAGRHHVRQQLQAGL